MNRQLFIFLDVDGVLNNDRFRKSHGSRDHIDSGKVALLAEIVKLSGAKLVLTSTWKIYLNLNLSSHNADGAYLLDKLGEYGLCLFAMTDDSGDDRGEGILNFLYENPCDSFVILDDEQFDFKETGLLPNLVLTDDKAFNGGLTEKDVEKALMILGC